MIASTFFRSLVFGFAIAAAAPAMAQTNSPPPPPPSSSDRPAPPQACPRGTHWEEAGYIGHGKYRPARCARDDGRE